MQQASEMGSKEASNNSNGEVNEKKVKEKVEKVSLLRLFSFAASLDYALMALGSLSACVHGASLPFFLMYFGKLINVIGASFFFSPSSLPTQVAKYALDFVYLGVVILFSAWIEVASWMYTGERQAAKMRVAYLEALLNQDIAVFDTEASTAAMIAGVTSDVIVLQDAISEKVGKVMHCISRFIAGFAIGFSQIWEISLVTLSIVPVIAVAGGIFAYTSTGFVARVRKSYVKAGEIAEEVIGNIRTVKAFVGEEKAVNEYRNALLRTYQYGKKAAMAKGLGLGSVCGVLFCSWGLLIWFTSRVVHKKISNGAEAFTTMITVFIAGLSLGQAAPYISTVIEVKATAHPIFEMIERNKARVKAKEGGGGGVAMPGKKKTLQARNNNNVHGHIQFDQVHFSYPSRPNVPIFRGLDLDIPAGKIVALVGGSGSGKSTIISLIERFYDPLSGVVLLDGQDIKGLDLQWLRQQIGLVNQEPALFATTILDNILYGKEGATIEEINHAASLANASMFINNLPDQYQTQVGDRGIQLSGGQKQRIAIARVMLKNPRILLLDEATSALDAESEKSIQEGLDRAMLGRTTVVVAHRLSTIRAADLIVVVDGGRVIETGTHDELMRDPTGAYASLVQLQASAPEQGPGHLQIASIGHSKRSTSFTVSFRSDKDSFVSYYGALEAEEATGQAKGAKGVPARRLYSMVGPDWNLGLVGTMGAFATGSQMPLFTLGISQALVAYYMDWETTQREIRRIALLFCGGALVTLVVHTMQHVSFGIMGERLALRVRQKTFSAILQNEIGWFDEASHNSTILSSRLENDATLLRTIVVDRSGVLLQSIGLIVTAFIITFILSWRITLVVLATYPLLICANISEQLFLKGFGGNLNKAYLKANMIAAEAVGNIRTVASFCLQDKVIKLFASQLDEPARHSLLRGHIAGIFYGFSQCCLYSSYGLGLWYGSVLMSRGQISFPSLMKTFMVLVVSAFAIAETLAMAPDIIRGNQMAESLFELMDTETDTDGADGAANDGSQGRMIGMVELKGVEFCYPSRPEEVVLRDMDLRVRPGKTMALVGMSGSGKSTVLALILRFYDPSAGKVLIDGKDIRNFHLKSLRTNIGLVQQEPALFATTIYDNIAYGNNSATEAEVIQAAKIANAHSFISTLPQGYSTKVGERGVQLSGGQKQRVAIARAVLKDPVILLLDEATSALDVESERAVQQALDKVAKTRTTIVVAHRLTTVCSADTISVLQEGKIIEQGSHENLLANKNGAYYKLISLQQQQQ